ncbi:MAG: hypothetical protein H7Y10_03765 [Flavobacterium sp.]|nr:hypothetical protein [Flavobacterium sp.]
MVIVNGKTINTNGSNIVISGGKIILDGKEVALEDAKEINIEITGNVDVLNVDNCNQINITGDSNEVKTHNGSVDIGGNVKGSVSTHNGNIDCQDVGGNVSTRNGNIKHRKINQ